MVALIAPLLALFIAQAGPTPVDMSASVAPLVDRVKASVVTIQSVKVITRMSREDPFMEYLRERLGVGRTAPRKETQQSLGSGFIVTKDGVILTNNHVVAGADEVRVQLGDGRLLEAKVVGRDDKTDVAVVRLAKPPQDLRPVTLGDSEKVRVGDYVLAIGNPLGLGQTVTMGIVSAKNRALDSKINLYEDFIQTDAAINQGNSGGPLFNFKGEVIGVNSAILNPAMAMNVGFAIPINLAWQIAQQLQRGKGAISRGYLGVYTDSFTPERARRLGIQFEPGAVVVGIEPRSPAASAGLRTNDVIVELAGRRVESTERLTAIVQSRAPDETVSVVVLRGGQRQSLQIKVGTQPAPRADSVLGIQVIPMSASEIEEQGFGGLRVVGVDARGSASGSLQEGDVITHVVVGGRAAAATVARLRDLEQRLKKGGWGRLVLVRNGYQLILNLG